VSGVRTEHDLRAQLRDCLEKCERLERGLREAHRYAYGHPDKSDLMRLRQVLAATGFPKNPPDEPVGHV
jgi:hypothetical protein